MQARELKGTTAEKRNGVGLVRLNRPEKRNALNGETLADLTYLLDAWEADPDVRVILLTGNGRAFCAGGDIGGEENMDVVGAFHGGIEGNALMKKMEKCRLPIIAAINGHCLGGGYELALACDIRIASEQAKIGLPEVTLGILPGSGGTQRLARLVGPGKAKLLLFTGDQVTARRALELGMVDMVFPAESMLDEAMAFAERIASMPPLSLEYIKCAVNEGLQMDLDRGLLLESALLGQLFGTEDQREAMRAFLEKRPHKPFMGK